MNYLLHPGSVHKSTLDEIVGDAIISPREMLHDAPAASQQEGSDRDEGGAQQRRP